MRRKTFLKSGYRGQALMEFALVLPVLLVLALFLVQYGIIYRTTIGLSNLAREGARYAATAPTSDAAIDKRVQDVTPSNIKYSDVTVTINPAEGNSARLSGSGGNITVKISYDMRKKVFLPSTFLGAHLFAQTYNTQSTFAVE